MARESNRLTDAAVKAAKKPGWHPDGAGLYLQVAKGGTKSWIFRYLRNGKDTPMGLGSARDVTLKEARELAHEARRQRRAGIDPIDARDRARAAAKAESAALITFRVAAEKFIAAEEDGWINPTHSKQWPSTLKRFAYPVIGDVSVAAINTAMVLKVIEPIWATKYVTAKRIQERIERVLNWATVREYRSGPNPAAWRGHLEMTLPGRASPIERRPALPYDAIPSFMADLRAREGISARALEFLTLTAARTGAVLGATWDEIDLKAKVWTVPPGRAGAKNVKKSDPKPRFIPLSDRAVEILKSLPREGGNPFLFIGARRGKALSNMAMAELMKGMAPPSTTTGKIATPHGMRSTFKDWCSEKTRFETHVVDAALWHAVADKVEAAYRRGDLLEKRCKLMDAWAAYCQSPVRADGENVVDIGAGRKM